MRQGGRAGGARIALVGWDDGPGGSSVDRARGLARALEARGAVVLVPELGPGDGAAVAGVRGLDADTVLVGSGNGATPRLLAALAGPVRGAGGVLLALVPDADPGRAARMVEAGADDVIAPPWSASSVLLRRGVVRSRVARGAGSPANGRPALCLGPLELDRDSREVRGDGRTARLSGREFDLLVALGAAEGGVVRRERLLSEVWGHDEGDGASVLDATVHRLRRRLEEGGIDADVVETVRSVGYRISPSLLEGTDALR